MCNQRLDAFRQAIKQENAQAFFMRDESDMFWLTGFDGVFDGEGAFSLLVTPDRACLHTDSRYAVAVERAVAGTPFQVNLDTVSHASFAAATLRSEGFEEKESLSLAVENSISLGEFRRLEQAASQLSCTVDIAEWEGFTVGLRAVKDANEIARMRAAQAITDSAFSHIVAYMRPGMTEREVQVELEDFMLRNGAAGLAFSSIVATGENGASAHAIPGKTRLEAGQCVVLDFGARAQGYCSDMTRVVFLGAPDQKMAQAYATLREANEAVERALRPGMTGEQAHQMAEDVLAANGFGGKMGHSLGHGVGIDIHEQPNLSLRNKQPLVPGNVVTVEPGIYLAGEFGMRLEDFGVITESGFDVFTQSTHEMVII